MKLRGNYVLFDIVLDCVRRRNQLAMHRSFSIRYNCRNFWQSSDFYKPFFLYDNRSCHSLQFNCATNSKGTCIYSAKIFLSATQKEEKIKKSHNAPEKERNKKHREFAPKYPQITNKKPNKQQFDFFKRNMLEINCILFDFFYLYTKFTSNLFTLFILYNYNYPHNNKR